MGRMHHKVVQFVGHGRLLNLFFGSSQTDVWLPRYGHSKFWGGVVHKTKFTFGLHAVVSNYAQTWCKPKCMVYMEKGSMWACVNYDIFSECAAGCAGSDFTTCLPVPWRGWGPLVRSKQAVFRVLDFERIGVLGCLATIVEGARSIRTGSNSAHGSSTARCARRTCVCWNQAFIFGFLVRQRWSKGPFSIIGHVVVLGSNAPQTSTIFRSRTVIQCGVWLVSNGWLVAEIWSSQV